MLTTQGKEVTILNVKIYQPLMKIRSSQHNKLFLFFFKEIYQSKEQNIIEKQAKDMNRQVKMKNTSLIILEMQF